MSLNLKSAIFISLICHIVMFNNIELTFSNRIAEKGRVFAFSKIFFLGSILDTSTPLGIDGEHSRKIGYSLDRIITKSNAGLYMGIKPALELYTTKSNAGLYLGNKITYFQPSPIPLIRQANSGIMFYPPMPYHFLLYFKDRQTAHMEVAFYISPEGKVARIKRKISSGNPEVDLLIMRNLTHFLNLCESNFALGSWQTVKIDLSP